MSSENTGSAEQPFIDLVWALTQIPDDDRNAAEEYTFLLPPSDTDYQWGKWDSWKFINIPDKLFETISPNVKQVRIATLYCSEDPTVSSCGSDSSQKATISYQTLSPEIWISTEVTIVIENIIFTAAE